MKPELYIYCEQATHFLRWEVPEFSKYFTLVDKPSKDAIVLSFGPDVIERALELPGKRHFAILFPGFGHNPLHNPEIRKLHRKLLPNFDGIFINEGPLQKAYEGLDNIHLYPFSVDTDFIKLKGYRKRIDSLVHVSSATPQKDWERSEDIMKRTGLRFNVFPPRNEKVHNAQRRKRTITNRIKRAFRIKEQKCLPYGYLDHRLALKAYQKHDAFVHVARDVKHKIYLDGKYTAAFIEAGLTGAILFWHDTYGVGNTLKTVFELPLDPEAAAKEILRIRSTIDVREHSERTRQEILKTFNPESSVHLRSQIIIDSL